MSDFRAVAAVTATLHRNLQAAVQADVPGAMVTTVPPAEGENANVPVTGVNLYLYQVSPNPSWRNADLPTRRGGGNGELVQRPQAAIDLHYVLSFYGNDLALEPQRLLGSTVAFLHSQPVLTRAQIAAAISDATRPYLADSDLADQVDVVRLAPLPLSLEELSRIWSVFFQVRYVLSVAYQASVVLVERQLSTQPVLPVRALNLAGVPLRRPAVARVVAEAGEDNPIVAGSTVVAVGRDLRADVARVEIDGADIPVGGIRSDRVAVTLPADLAGGAHSLRVRHGVVMGAPGEPHLAVSSNVAAFVLEPRISRTGNQYDIAVTDVVGTGPAPRSATVTIGVSPKVYPGQRVTLEMLTGGGVVHTFLAPPRQASLDAVAFTVANVTSGSYVFRVRVDGAGSAIESDADGKPTGPAATIP